ncbi:TPA: aminoacyltransferase [Streptococcus suis]|nr:aminoacyltransferase [Streptococcus suis]HEL2384501.1 aminoacyltransferase [Streptococcus suis]
MSLIEITAEEFSEIIQSVDKKSFIQSVEMANLLKKRGMKTHFLAYNFDNQYKVVALLFSMAMTGGLYLELNSGPVCLDEAYLEDFYRALKEYASKNGVLELVVKPYQTYQTFDTNGEATSAEKTEIISTLTDIGYQHDGLQTGYPGGEPDWHYVKDLTDLTQENLIQSFSKKGRPLVKKAKTFGIKLRRLERNDLSLFKEITSSTSERREYSDKTLDYYEQFYDSFGSNTEFMVASLNFQDYYKHLEKDQKKLADKLSTLQVKLESQPQSKKYQNQINEFSQQYDTFTTRMQEAKDFINKYGKQDVILAGSLFIYTPQEAVYLFSGSYTEFNKFYAPALLQEHVMLEAIKRGISFYNFLGITGVFDGSDGVLRFKQNFNGYIVRKTGTFRYYPRPLKFKVLQLIKKLLRR